MVNHYPPSIDATPEQIANVMLAPPPSRVVRAYRCRECEKAVHYPDTLHDDGRCSPCHRHAA